MCLITYLVDYFEVILKKLHANKLITLPDNFIPYDPILKTPWWKKKYFCNYHRNTGHEMDHCLNLKDVIQYIIDEGRVGIDRIIKNYNHKDFEELLPMYENGET